MMPSPTSADWPSDMDEHHLAPAAAGAGAGDTTYALWPGELACVAEDAPRPGSGGVGGARAVLGVGRGGAVRLQADVVVEPRALAQRLGRLDGGLRAVEAALVRAREEGARLRWAAAAADGELRRARRRVANRTAAWGMERECWRKAGV
jgi:hypothetical protein